MFKFKKIASVLASSVMLTSTIALAAAANYPAPFSTNGADTAIVYGTNAANTDFVAVVDITNDLLGHSVASSVTEGTTTASVEGEAVSLNSGSDLLYLNDELNENVQTVTKDDLPTVLADGTFTDDGGTDFDYEQTIVVNSGATTAFENSDNDLDEPTLIVKLPTSTGTPIYTSTIVFDDAVNFTDSDSEGEQITFFGKTYTVGTATDATDLVLLGGSSTETFEVGETKTVTVGADTFEVTLNGITTADNAAASITINGETKTFTEGQTKKFGDTDVFAKTVSRYADNIGLVELQIGADKLTLRSSSKVMSGSDDTKIDGTLVTITGGTGAMTKLEIGIAAEDNDVNHILPGESFADPVFGSIKVDFDSISNGPTIVDHDDTATSRNTLSIVKGGNRELELTVTDKNGVEKTIPFTYQNSTQDDSGNDVELWEGATIEDEEYFFLNGGDNQHFMQLTDMDLTAGGATDDTITFEDMFSGTDYTIEGNMSGSGKTKTIGSHTYTITQYDADSVRIVSSDYSTGNGTAAVYPYMELVNGADHKFAYTDEVTISESMSTSGTAEDSSRTYDLPTGSIQLKYTNNSAAWSYRVDGGSWTTRTADDDTYTIGSVDYVVKTTFSANVSLVLDSIGIEATQSSTGDVSYDAPAILFVEDEDKAETVTTTENAVVLKTTDTGTYSIAETPILTATNQDSASFDDSDFTGYIDTFGTYVLLDSSDTNQDFTSLSYPKNQMYFNVYFAEESAVINGGNGDDGGTTFNVRAYPDSQYSSLSDMNIIAVGGSCVNSVALTLLGLSGVTCGADWTTATNVGSGQFLIQTFDRGENKVATLVAGFNAGDTTNAATFLTTQTVDTTVGKKYIGTSGTSASLVAATATDEDTTA